ncbi:MAG: hypothetical protein STSR0008_05220 [Ignavibacterium sp.]
MKKYISLFVFIFFVSAVFAQRSPIKNVPEDLRQSVLNKKQEEVAKLKDPQQKFHLMQMNNTFLKNHKKINATKHLNNVTADAETLFYDKFEGTVNWTTVDLTMQPTYTHISGYHAFAGNSWWCGDSVDTWETSPGYGNNWVQYLTTINGIDLTGLTSASFDFQIKYDVEEDYDFVNVIVSTDDGTTWTSLAEYTGVSTDWESISIDLATYIGQTVKIGFLFTSDGSYSDEDGNNDSDGAYFVDDIKIVKDSTPTLIDDGGDSIIGMEAYPGPSIGDFWNLTDVASNSPTHSFWNGDPATGEYVPNTINALISPEIDLTGVDPLSSVIFDFYLLAEGMEYVQSPLSYDYWSFEVSDDGGLTWTNPTPYIYVGDWNDGSMTFVKFSEGSSVGEVYLNDYIGKTIQIRFLFVANANDVVGTGFFLDDPVVYAEPNPDTYEPNDDYDIATPITYGFISAEGTMINPTGDIDIFTFNGTAGDWVDVYVDNIFYDAEVYLELDNGDGTTTILDFADGYYYDRIFGELPETGKYYVWIWASSWDPDAVGPYQFSLFNYHPEANVTQVQDIPNDQGLQVRVTFNTSDFDDAFIPLDNRTTQYSLWRQAPPSKWDFITEIPSLRGALENVSYVAPTLRDSSNSVFRVLMHTNTDNLWGATGSGMSLDNLAPTFANTNGGQTANGVKLGWLVDFGTHYDVVGFRIYKSTDANFTPSADNLIGTFNKDAKEYTDADVTIGTTYFYYINVYDDGGNSTLSEKIPVIVTGVEDEIAIPEKFVLNQNYPNPFNPSTIIKFGLPVQSQVVLKIFNVLGQEVQTLYNGTLEAGYHNFDFNAKNLTTGMYIYTINAEGSNGEKFSEVKKMLLVK